MKPLGIFNETSGQFPASPFSLPACQIQQPGPRPPPASESDDVGTSEVSLLEVPLE